VAQQLPNVKDIKRIETDETSQAGRGDKEGEIKSKALFSFFTCKRKNFLRRNLANLKY